MEPGTSEDHELAQAEVAEQLALKKALKRTKLEEASQSPSYSWMNLAALIVVSGFVLFFNSDIGGYLSLIVIFLLTMTWVNTKSIHARIDAILELDELKNSEASPPYSKRQNKMIKRIADPLRVRD